MSYHLFYTMTLTITKDQKAELTLSDQTICVSDIVFVQGEGNYSKFHMADGRTIVSCRTLKYFEPTLLEIGFVRPSKSFIVNLNAIDSIDFHNSKIIRLNNSQQVTISRRQIKPLKDLFKAMA